MKYWRQISLPTVKLVLTCFLFLTKAELISSSQSGAVAPPTLCWKWKATRESTFKKKKRLIPHHEVLSQYQKNLIIPIVFVWLVNYKPIAVTGHIKGVLRVWKTWTCPSVCLSVCLCAVVSQVISRTLLVWFWYKWFTVLLRRNWWLYDIGFKKISSLLKCIQLHKC